MFAALKKYLDFSGKVIFIFAVCMVVLNVFIYSMTSKNHASTTPTKTPTQEYRDGVYRTIDSLKASNNKDAQNALAFYRFTTCAMMGEGCTDNPNDGDKNFDNSLFGYVGMAIAAPYVNQPASGVYWVRSGLENAGFVPKTYAAQGIGFAALRPLAGIWELFRNLTFALIVLALVIIGFLIMFRFKINPQTVIAMENALPRIMITLLLITFSFAIGGFLIDFMYTISLVLVGIIGNYQIDGTAFLTPEKQMNIVTGSGGFTLFQEILWNSSILGMGDAIYSILPTFVANIVKGVAASIAIFFVTRLEPIQQLWSGKVLALESWCAGLCQTLGAVMILGITGIFFGFYAGIILSILILLFTAITVFFRIFILLFRAYLRIILNIIFAPLILLPGIIPGRSSFSSWIKRLFADLTVFPIVMVMLMVSQLLVKIPVAEGSFWQPPFLNSSINPKAFNTFVSIGMLFLIPQVVNAVREMLGVKSSPFKFGAGLFLGGIAGAAGGGLGIASQFGSLSHAVSGASNLKKYIATKRGAATPPASGH